VKSCGPFSLLPVASSDDCWVTPATAETTHYMRLLSHKHVLLFAVCRALQHRLSKQATRTLQQQVQDTQVLLLRQPTAAAAAAWATCRACLGAGLAAAAAGEVELQILTSCSAGELEAASCLDVTWAHSDADSGHCRHSQQPSQQHPSAAGTDVWQAQTVLLRLRCGTALQV
jgi:hypothetical protein